MIALLAPLLLFSGPLADIGPAPEVELTDAQGRPFRLADLRGRAVVVSFIYTTCNGTCPLTTAALDRVRSALKARHLWGDRVAFVSITLDPERDTPEVLRRYASIYRAEPSRWHFLTGPPEKVRAVLKAWDMWARVGPSGRDRPPLARLPRRPRGPSARDLQPGDALGRGRRRRRGVGPRRAMS